MSQLSDMLREVAAHIDACPLGYSNGKVITTRATTDGDVVMWLARLHQLRWRLDDAKRAAGDARSDVEQAPRGPGETTP